MAGTRAVQEDCKEAADISVDMVATTEAASAEAKADRYSSSPNMRPLLCSLCARTL